jgi:hypothetical protein
MRSDETSAFAGAGREDVCQRRVLVHGKQVDELNVM